MSGRRRRRAVPDSLVSREAAERLRLREVRSPFEGMSREQVVAFFAGLGSQHQRAYAATLRNLDTALLKADPVMLLANLATYLSSHPKGTDRELSEARPVLPFHLEFVQALALTHPLLEYRWEPGVPPDLVQRVRDGAQEAARSWALRDFANAAGTATGPEQTRRMALARIRLDTAAVRNWGFPDQMARILSEMLAPLDGTVESRVGLRPTALLGMFAAVIALIEGRYHGLLRRMAKALVGPPTVRDLVAAYDREFPGATGADALVVMLEARNATLDEARAALVMHREISYPDLYTLTVDDLAACYPGEVDRGALLSVARSWSLGFGDLAGRSPDHFFLDNPVRKCPFVRLEDGAFFCPNVGALHSFGLGLIETLLDGHPDLKERYEGRRSKYLESRVEALFREHFPSARVYAGSMWRNSATGDEGENDLLVVLDEFAVVVEAKSGRITDEALRGRPKRLEYTVRKLVAEPAGQGQRFAALLRADPGPHRFATKDRRTNEVDCSGVRRFVVLNATLELFGLLGLRWPLLREAGLVPADLDPTPTLSLADIEILMDVLEGEARLLHYLARRADLEALPHVAGDELDLLGYYLQTGFHIGVLESADDRFVDLGLQSKLIDQIVPLPRAERPIDLPGTRLAPLWRHLVEDLEVRKPRGWSTAVLRLLDVPFEAQRRFARDLDDVAGKARRAPGMRVVRQAQLKTGPVERRQELIAVAFKGYAPDDAAAHVADLVVAADGRRGPLVVFTRVEDGRRPVVAG